MSVPIYSESTDLILDRLVSNVAVDAPIAAAELLRAYNEAYADVWEASGAAVTSVGGSTSVWTAAPTTTTDGRLVGVLRDIKEILHVGATLTSNAKVVGDSDVSELDHVEYSQIQWARSNTTIGTYTVPQMYAVTRRRASSDVAANVNRYDLDVWPGVASYFFPIEYLKQFAPLAGAGTDVPDVNDIEGRDIALLAALRLCPAVGRPELAPGIAMDVSERTRKALERKFGALMSGDQDA